MSSELKVVHKEWKSLRQLWRKAKFFPSRVPGGVELTVTLPSIFTCECVTDSKANVLTVTALAENPEVPHHLHTVVGEVGWKEIRFRCDLTFHGDDVRWDEMSVKQERKGDVLTILVTRRGGGKWLTGTDIYAAYKGRGWGIW